MPNYKRKCLRFTDIRGMEVKITMTYDISFIQRAFIERKNVSEGVSKGELLFVGKL